MASRGIVTGAWGRGACHCRSETYNADNGHQTLFITVEADASFTGNVYKVGPQEVRVGYEYILKTSEFELTGLICALEVTDG